jgi:hypothetical protein
MWRGSGRRQDSRAGRGGVVAVTAVRIGSSGPERGAGFVCGGQGIRVCVEWFPISCRNADAKTRVWGMRGHAREKRGLYLQGVLSRWSCRGVRKAGAIGLLLLLLRGSHLPRWDGWWGCCCLDELLLLLLLLGGIRSTIRQWSINARQEKEIQEQSRSELMARRYTTPTPTLPQLQPSFGVRIA